MLNKELEKEFQHGLRDTVYYLWADDPLLLEHALTRAIDTVISGAPIEFNYDLFYPSSTIEEIRDTISTVPFMAKRRLVVLKDLHRFPDEVVNAILPSLKNPPDTVCIIILSHKAPQKGFNIKGRIYNLNISEGEMLSWVKKFSFQKGIRLSDDAINLLLEFTGYDAGLLSMEIEKLGHLGRKTITDKDIIDSVTMRREWTSFELIDCLLKGEKAKALRILKAMFDGGNAHDVATLLLGALNWHFREFYNLWLQDGRKPLRMNDKRYTILKGHLTSYNEKRFYNLFHALHNADIMIKTGGRPELIMEVLLLNLLERAS